MPRIKIDPLRCEGAGRCRVQAPHTFKVLNDRAEVVSPTGDPIKAIVAAARRCPTRAIAVFDDDGAPLFIPNPS
jgi:ferredoxin